ncbi:hypothetical protein NKI12_16410 [Mesorhizobium australicum]|uniref:Uncharacterized protein n=1 Tax=Mesorhizobium australicum TaxID=536018 RepID=A0ACC6T041_9HYPH
MSIEDAIAKAIKDAIRVPVATHVDDLFNYRIDNIIKSAIKEAILENMDKWHTAPEDVVRGGISEALKQLKA